MKITRQIILFFTYYFILYFAQAIAYVLLISFLTGLGYTATQRSVFFVVDAIAGMILQVVIGYLCDRHQKIKPYLYIVSIFYAVGTYFMYRTTAMQFWLHMLLVTLISSMTRLTMSLSDSITIETSTETRDNYGVIRLFGSIGWAVGSPITAILAEKFGYPFLGIAFIFVIVLSFVVLWGIRDVNKVKSSEPVSLKDVKALLANRTYRFMVMVLFLINIVDMTQSYSVVDKMWYLNGSERDIGNYWLMAAMMELPLFFLGGWLVKKFGAVKLLIISGIFYTLRYVVYGIAGSIMMVFVGGLLQGLTYPLLMVSSKILIDDESPDNMKTSGQQVANSIYGGGSAMIAPVLVGVLEDGLGINPSLFAIAALALLPTVMMLFYHKKTEKVL